MKISFILVSAILILSACASTHSTRRLGRNPASFDTEHEPATFWLQCQTEAKIEKVDAPFIRSDGDDHVSGGPYCKITKGQCALTDGSRTFFDYPKDVTCNLKPTGECPGAPECVHEAIEPARKQQDWERQRTPARNF